MTRHTLRSLAQARSDRILPNVRVVVFVIVRVANAVIHETCLPYFESKMNFPFPAIGETALDELECLFQRDFRCRCQQQMEVIGHDHKFIQQKPPLLTILRQPRTLVRGPPEAEPCDRIEEARDVRQSSRSGKTYGLIGELGAFSPGLKARSLQDKAFSRV